jgi:hypothetical protein
LWTGISFIGRCHYSRLERNLCVHKCRNDCYHTVVIVIIGFMRFVMHVVIMWL